MNQIGVRAHDYGRMAPDSLFAHIAADGWETVQLAIPKCIEGIYAWKDITPERVEQIRRALRINNLSVAVLGAYVELGMVEPTLREQAVKIFRNQLPFAKMLGAGCVGSETTNMASQPGITREEALVCLEHSLSEILPDAEALGVTVAIEPVFSHTMATPELTRRVLTDMASPALQVIFDPGNLFSPQDASHQQDLWQRAFEAFGDRIAAVHIKGVRMESGVPAVCALEDSQLDYTMILQLLRQTGRKPALLREEAIPSRATQEIAMMRTWL